MQYNFNVTGDRLTLSGEGTGNSGNANTYRGNFEFAGNDWDGYAPVAVFLGTQAYIVPILEERCTFPSGILAEPNNFFVGIYGVDGTGKRISTNLISFTVNEGALQVSTIPETPDIWEQYISAVSGYVSRAETASESAAESASGAASSKTAAESAADAAETYLADALNAKSQAETFKNAAEAASSDAANARNQSASYAAEAAGSASQAEAARDVALQALDEHNASGTSHGDIRADIAGAISGADTALTEHNISVNAHEDIRSGIKTAVTLHNSGNAAHPDIRQAVAEINGKFRVSFTEPEGDELVWVLPPTQGNGWGVDPWGDADDEEEGGGNSTGASIAPQADDKPHIYYRSTPDEEWTELADMSEIPDLSGYAASAEVSGEISNHNESSAAHPDIRQAIETAISGVYRYKGSANSDYLSDKGTSSAEGDVYNLYSAGTIRPHYQGSISGLTFTLTKGMHPYVPEEEFFIQLGGDGAKTAALKSALLRGGELTGTSTSTGTQKTVRIDYIDDAYIFGGDGDGNTYTLTSVLLAPPVTVQAGDNVAWTSGGWDKLSATVDITGAISAHNSSHTAHEDIRTNITTAVNSHNESPDAHADIRQAIADISGRTIKVESWEDVQSVVRSGLAPQVFKIGEQFEVSRGSDTLTFDIIGFDAETPVSPDYTRSMTLQLHDPQDEVIYCPSQAAFYFPEGLSAGDYYFRNNNTNYYFTITAAIPAGGQIVIKSSGSAITSDSLIETYPEVGGAASLESNITLSTTSTGTASGIGTITGTVNGNINSVNPVLHGSNEWETSYIRQWLNSEGVNWWTAQTVFDRPPASIDPGFLTDMDADFLAVVGEVRKKTQKNISYGYGLADTVERFFCPSRPEVYGGTERAEDGADGAVYAYYGEGYSSLAEPGIGRDTHRKKRGARYWRLRTPLAGNAYSSRLVTESGNISTANANLSFGVAPACVIW